MTIYKYQALDLKGQKQQGIIEAGNESEAKDRLRSQGLMVIGLTVRKGTSRKENLKNEILDALHHSGGSIDQCGRSSTKR